MNEKELPQEHLDSIADFYSGRNRDESDRLMRALESWDYDRYRPLQSVDPELYELIVNQIGSRLEIDLGSASVRLGGRDRHIELTWNGEAEDLIDLVLEGAKLISDA